MKNLKKLTACLVSAFFISMQMSYACLDTGLGKGLGGAEINNVKGGFVGMTKGTNNANLHFNGNSVVNWNKLNLNKGETLNYNAAGGSGGVTVLNTVNQGMSKIYGNINANKGISHLIISNPNGILFDGSKFTAAGDLTISTQNMSNVTLEDLNNNNFTNAAFSKVADKYGNPINIEMKNNATFEVAGKYNILTPGMSLSIGGDKKLVTNNGQDYLEFNNDYCNHCSHAVSGNGNTIVVELNGQNSSSNQTITHSPYGGHNHNNQGHNHITHNPDNQTHNNYHNHNHYNHNNQENCNHSVNNNTNNQNNYHNHNHYNHNNQENGNHIVNNNTNNQNNYHNHNHYNHNNQGNGNHIVNNNTNNQNNYHNHNHYNHNNQGNGNHIVNNNTNNQNNYHNHNNYNHNNQGNGNHIVNNNTNNSHTDYNNTQSHTGNVTTVNDGELSYKYYMRALQKYMMGDLQGSKADLTKSISHNLENADAYYYRAAINKQLGDMSGFNTDYNKAVNLNPNFMQSAYSNSVAFTK